jgi:flagellin
MVSSVNTNVNAMAAIQSLDQISNQMTTTQSAIESGLSVSSAADNPAVFTIAQGLRANVGALSAVSSNLNTAVATVQAQTQGATSISDALQTLLNTVTQGQGQTGAALDATNATITNALSNIDAYANASTINGTNLLSSANTFSVVSNVDGSTTSVTTGTASTSAGLGLSGLQITTGGTTLAANSTAIATGDTVTYTNGANSTVFEFNDGTAALTTTPSATTTVVAVNMDNAAGTANTAGQNMGALLTAMQSNGVAASEDSSGTITVTGAGTITASASLSTGTVSGGTSAIDAVNSAIAQIGATLSQLGATTIQLQGLEDFTTQLSDSVTTGLGAMVDANLSAESAQLSSLQTKQSLAIQSLTLANQGPSALLQLFR